MSASKCRSVSSSALRSSSRRAPRAWLRDPAGRRRPPVPEPPAACVRGRPGSPDGRCRGIVEAALAVLRGVQPARPDHHHHRVAAGQRGVDAALNSSPGAMSRKDRLVRSARVALFDQAGARRCVAATVADEDAGRLLRGIATAAPAPQAPAGAMSSAVDRQQPAGKTGTRVEAGCPAAGLRALRAPSMRCLGIDADAVWSIVTSVVAEAWAVPGRGRLLPFAIAAAPRQKAPRSRAGRQRGKDGARSHRRAQAQRSSALVAEPSRKPSREGGRPADDPQAQTGAVGAFCSAAVRRALPLASPASNRGVRWPKDRRQMPPW